MSNQLNYAFLASIGLVNGIGVIGLRVGYNFDMSSLISKQDH